MKKSSICLFLLAALLIRLPYAQGQKSAQFLKVIESAGKYALGDGLPGSTGHADNIFYSPAALAGDSITAFSVNYTADFQKLKGISLAGVYRSYTWGSLGLGLSTFLYGSVQETDAFGLAGGEIKTGSLQISAAYHNRLFKMLDLGLGLKFLNEKLTDDTSSPGFASDLGINLSFGRFHPLLKQLELGAALQNLGVSRAYGESSYSLPIILRTGLCYGLKLSLKHSFLLSAGMDMTAGEGAAANFGLGFTLFNLLTLRAGYHSGEIKTGFKAGIGLSFRGLSIDYSFGLHDLGMRNLIGISMSTDEMARKKSPKEMIEAYYYAGIMAFADKDYDKAAQCFRNILEIDPQYTKAKLRLAETKVLQQKKHNLKILEEAMQEISPD